MFPYRADRGDVIKLSSFTRGNAKRQFFLFLFFSARVSVPYVQSLLSLEETISAPKNHTRLQRYLEWFSVSEIQELSLLNHGGSCSLAIEVS